MAQEHTYYQIVWTRTNDSNTDWVEFMFPLYCCIHYQAISCHLYTSKNRTVVMFLIDSLCLACQAYPNRSNFQSEEDFSKIKIHCTKVSNLIHIPTGWSSDDFGAGFFDSGSS